MTHFAGILLGQLLVQIHAQTGLVVDIQIALVVGIGTAGEHFLLHLGMTGEFLNTEVGGNQIQVNLGSHTDRRQVAGAMPCRLDAKDLAELRQLVRRAEAADLADVNADIINQEIVVLK